MRSWEKYAYMTTYSYDILKTALINGSLCKKHYFVCEFD